MLLWDSGTSIPRGVDVDHAARGPFYAPAAKPPWFTLTGTFQRPGQWPALAILPEAENDDFATIHSIASYWACAVTHTWHNAVHTAVGGDMLNVQFSPRDPIFWRFHRFVDTVSQDRLTALAMLGMDHPEAEAAMRAADLNDQNQADSPPRINYQEPFRLYRFLDKLDQVSVEFDQTVIGVKAGSVLVNGRPASSVERVSGTRYIFSGFPEPELGEIEIEVVPGAIKNVNNIAFEGDRWEYFRVDPDLDEDRDGLKSHDEIYIYLTSPIDRDSDDDGLADGDEVNLHKTRPLMWDSDMDGANDKCELEKGSDPNDPTDTARGCPVSSVFVCYVGNGDSLER